MPVLLGELSANVPGRKIQVLLHQDGGVSSIQLREQHQAEGLGWFDQRHLTLDPAQLAQLLSLLGQAVHPVATTPNTQDVLGFPTPVSNPIASERKLDVI